MFNFFKKQGELNGTIEISDLPPFKGYSISISLFPVKKAESPPPYEGDPPLTAIKDEETIAKKVHFEREDKTGSIQAEFCLHRPVGWYYVQINTILYREHATKMFAQVDRFFFRKRPLEITLGEEQHLTLPVSWPPIRIEELEHYGTIKPQQ